MQNHLLPKFRSYLLPHTRTLIYTFFTSQFHTSNTNELQSLSNGEVEEIRGEISNLASNFDDLKLQISHPWPEWVNLMEHVLKKGYFEGGIGREEMDTKETNQIRTGLLNFARDRFDIMRYFSKGDISVVLESGCPSLDRKVVNSGKRLRAHVGLGEGKVCSSCNLRGNCERAYVMAREDEGGRTVDVMRILLTYGLDPIIGSVENKPCLNKKVKDSARKLLSEMVEFSLREVDSDSLEAVPSKKPSLSPELSRRRTLGHIKVPMKQGDWICPKCNFHNFSKNIKCLQCDGLCQEKLRKLGENQDHLPLKKGDWLCGTCNFLNFAKNTRCLQCKEKPSRRELNPGEWECPSCNYVNFKRNMVCLKCDWKRPKASNYSDTTAQNQLEYEAHHRSNGLDFVRDDVGSESHGSRSARRTWTNLKDDQDDEMEAWNRFEDFPVAGGKSEVSTNENTKLKWKKLMERQRRNFSMESKDDDHVDENELDFRVPSNFVESSEDEEINDWFGCKK